MEEAKIEQLKRIPACKVLYSDKWKRTCFATNFHQECGCVRMREMHILCTFDNHLDQQHKYLYRIYFWYLLRSDCCVGDVRCDHHHHHWGGRPWIRLILMYSSTMGFRAFKLLLFRLNSANWWRHYVCTVDLGKRLLWPVQVMEVKRTEEIRT